jgi:hypothetical protein
MLGRASAARESRAELPRRGCRALAGPRQGPAWSLTGAPPEPRVSCDGSVRRSPRHVRGACSPGADFLRAPGICPAAYETTARRTVANGNRTRSTHPAPTGRQADPVDAGTRWQSDQHRDHAPMDHARGPRPTAGVGSDRRLAVHVRGGDLAVDQGAEPGGSAFGVGTGAGHGTLAPHRADPPRGPAHLGQASPLSRAGGSSTARRVVASASGVEAKKNTVGPLITRTDRAWIEHAPTRLGLYPTSPTRGGHRAQ